jgi:hypothetical protein
MAPKRAWHLGRGTGNTNVAKSVNPEHLSHMGKLVDEDVESIRVGRCETQSMGRITVGQEYSTIP